MPLIDLNGLGHFKDRENAMIAEDFSASKAYAAGDYCYYNGTLYKFKTAHAAGAWTTSDVEAAKLAGDVSALKESINTFFPVENLFDINTITPNKYIVPANGIIATLNDYNASDWIDIGADNYVTASANAFDLVVYNEDKTFSRNVERKYDNYPYTTKLTATEKYVRVTYKTSELSTAQVEKNMGQSSLVSNKGSVDGIFQNSVAYKETKIIVGTECYFETINQALSAITDNNEKNRYLIFVTEGEYNETITTKNYVDIEGESKYKSIINYINTDEEHQEQYSAIYATTNSEIRNITVRTTGSKYPLHCDGNFNKEYNFKAKNCIFRHDGYATMPDRGGTGVGLGLYWGQFVTLENCECTGIKTGSAGIYCHNALTPIDARYKRYRAVKVINSIINGYYGIRLQAIEPSAQSGLEKNGFEYIGNKNNGTIPFSLETTQGAVQSWNVFAINNTPPYTET